MSVSHPTAAAVTALAPRPTPRQRFWTGVNGLYCRWWFGMTCESTRMIPRSGPLIVVANHTSGIDPILLIACLRERPLGFLIAEEYYNLPVVGFLIHLMECIPIRRGMNDTRGTKAALRHLRAGKALGVFPEGRIPRPGEMVEPKDGAALLALKTGASVVPAHISGTRYSDDLIPCFYTRQHARVRFGPPIDLSSYRGRKGDKDTLTAISRMFMQHIRELRPS